MNIWIDGAGAPLPRQKAKACVVFEDGDVRVTTYESGTNNEMEYQALLLGLEDPRSDGATVHTDSQLLVGHLTKAWKVNAANLRPLHARAADLLSRKHATLVWIPRGQNRAGKVLEKSK